MRVLVTGTSGMIGSVFGEALLNAGHEVVAVDRRSNPWSTELEAMTRRVDLLDDSDVETLPRDIDAVVHLAANARVHDLVVEPRGARENMVSAFNVMEHARRAEAFCVFASSREVYGNRGSRHTEDDVDIQHVESPYAASKLAGEVMLRSYGSAYELPYAIVRFSNVYGRNDLSDRFVPNVFRRLMGGEPVTVYGEDKTLDFTYVDDAVEGLALVVEQPSVANTRTFNLSRGQQVRLIEAAEMMAELVGRPLDLRLEESRPGEVMNYEGDVTHAREALGFAPRTDLWEGLRRAAPWYAERRPPVHVGPDHPRSSARAG